MKLAEKIRNIRRRKYVKNLKKNIDNKNFTIFSQNCIGGIVYHDLGMAFTSPTINMYMKPADFIRFLKNTHKYTRVIREDGSFDTNIDIELISNEEYPIVQIDDIVVHGVHYKSFEEFCVRWRERCQRINWDNIYVIMTERDGCSYEDLCEFDALPYENKVVFVHKEMPEIHSSIYIPGTEEKNDDLNKVKVLTNWESPLSGRRVMDRFDFSTFFK